MHNQSKFEQQSWGMKMLYLWTDTQKKISA